LGESFKKLKGDEKSMGYSKRTWAEDGMTIGMRLGGQDNLTVLFGITVKPPFCIGSPYARPSFFEPSLMAPDKKESLEAQRL